MSTTGRPPIRPPKKLPPPGFPCSSEGETGVTTIILISTGTPGRHRLRARDISSEGGFTLLELMAVMALMALLVGLVLPGLMGSWERAGSRANLRKLTSALRLARSEAATQGHRVRVFLNLKNGRFQVEGSKQQGELTGMRLTDARLVWEDQEKSRGYIAFYGDGSSSGGKVVLEEPAGQRHLMEVKPVTGKVHLAMQEK
jgi:general secretion pathway protein H